MLGFLNVQKAIVLVKLLTESFLTVEQEQPIGGTFYTKEEETS